MATDDTDDTGDHGSAVEMTRQFMNSLSEGAGDEFVAEINDRFDGDIDLDSVAMGALSAGEAINQQRRQARKTGEQAAEAVSAHTAADTKKQRGDERVVVSRSVVDDDTGRHVGTRVWIDDDNPDIFSSEQQLLIRTSYDREIEVPIPNGVGDIERDHNEGITELLVRPLGYEADTTHSSETESLPDGDSDVDTEELAEKLDDETDTTDGGDADAEDGDEDA